MRYSNEDRCSTKDPFFNICLDLSNKQLMSDEEFDKFFTSLESTDGFKSSCQNLMKELDKRRHEFTKFEQFLLTRLMSINMCDELYQKKKFKLSFTKENLYEGCGGTWYYDSSKTYPDKLIDWFGTIDINFYWALDEVSIYYHIPETLFNKKYHDRYYDKEENDCNYYITHLYGLYKYILEHSNIKVIDKGNYIMFFLEDGPNVHLVRTPDNDVEWKEEQFLQAFIEIYKMYIDNPS